MSTGRLIRVFDSASAAPDAMVDLRAFIHALAVQGRLVPSLTVDEPAGDILDAIEKEIRRLKNRSLFREPRSALEIKRNNLPFSIPRHWRWCRLIELAELDYGFAFPSAKFNESKRGMPLIRIRDISKTDTEAYFEGEFDEAYVVRKGDFLVGMDGQFNLREWRGKDALLNQRVMRIKGWRGGVEAKFIAIPLQAILNHLHGGTSQTTVKHLSAKQINGVEIPLPPLAEQKRIVAKVDELMALCDALEAAQTKREGRRDRLVAATLHHLTNGADAKTQRRHATFYLNQLPRLTTRPEHIHSLRQTILDLAVRGKLVPQDPNDEPVDKVLAEIAHEKDRMAKAKECPKPKKLGKMKSQDISFALPAGWVGTRWGDISPWITYGFTRPMPHVDKGVPIVTAKNVINERIDFDTAHKTTDEAFFDLNPKDCPQKGDILITKDGTIGRVAIVEGDSPFCISQSVAVIWLRKCRLNREFLALVLRSAITQDQIWSRARGQAIKHLYITDLAKYLLPLAPLAEQKRIVAKVDELMALCDALEASLTTGSTTRRRLLEATLHEALAG